MIFTLPSVESTDVLFVSLLHEMIHSWNEFEDTGTELSPLQLAVYASLGVLDADSSSSHLSNNY